MTRILITAIGGAGVGDQILKSLHSLKNVNYELFGCDTKQNPLQSKQVLKYLQLSSASAPEYIDELYKICLDFEIEAVFLGSEPEIKRINHQREKFDREGIFLSLNSASFRSG